MRIEKIHIKGFRNFEDEEIFFQPKTLIIGANDVGKTNLLYALRILFDKSISEHDLDLKDSDYNAYCNTDTVEITATICDVTEECLLSTFGGAVKDGVVLIRYSNSKNGQYSIWMGYDENVLTEYSTRQYIKRLNMQYVDTNRDLFKFLKHERLQILHISKELLKERENIMYYKVFLDTNIYDGANYSFHNAMFSLLRKMTEDGALQLKINSVVEGEVKKHIGRDVKVAAKKLLEAVKDRSLSSFRNIPSFQDYLMIPNPKDWVQKAEEEFEEFLISCNCDRISINGIDVEKIMENYFNQKWPFEAAKTDEFKDAFIVASIIKDIIGTEDVLGITEDQTYCVISNDKGFRAALEQGTVGIEDVRIFPGLKEFTDYLAEKDNYAQHIKAFIESGNADDEIQEAVKEAINSADISVESLFWDIEELDILDIDEIEYTPYIISVYDEGIAKVSFAVTCKVTVYYKYTDENESYYDKEDQCYLWQKIVELEEEYTVAFDMVLSLDVSNCKPEMDEDDEEILFEDYTESPSCIELEKDRCISTEVVSETDPFYEDLDGEYDYATDVCPDCGSPIGIANDGGNGFCINCAPNH